MEKSNEEKKEYKHKHMPPVSKGSPGEPWLVYFHGKRKEVQTFYMISEDGQYHVKKIPRLRRKSLCTCSYGWMALTDSITNEFFLLNPTTMDEIQLPSVNFDLFTCVLSGPPSDPNFTVILISYHTGGGVYRFWLCSPKRYGPSPVVDEWMEQDFEVESSYIEDAVGYEGKIYVLLTSYTDDRIMTHKVMIAEVVGIMNLKVRVIEAQGWEICYKGIANNQLHPGYLVVDPRGWEIYVVNKIYLRDEEILDIQVFKLDITKENAWERVNDLGNRAIFLGPYLSTCFIVYVNDSGSRIKGNTVYFTMHEDMRLYAYHLEEKSITDSLPCSNVKHDCSQPSWIQMLPPGSI